MYLYLQVDQKLNEEIMGQEVDALVKCVDQHKAILTEQMMDEVSLNLFLSKSLCAHNDTFMPCLLLPHLHVLLCAYIHGTHVHP